jgi:hypothetical protein
MKVPRNVLHALARDEGPAHVFVIARERQFLRIQPDARRVFERAPLRFHGGAVGEGLGLRALIPRLRDFALGHHHVEAVQARRGRTVEVHFPEYGGVVPGSPQLLRERRLFVVERRLQHRHACRGGHLPRQKRLPRWRAHRLIAVVRSEPRPLRGKAVQVRRLGETVAVASEHVSGMVVGDEEEEVGLPPGGGEGGGTGARQHGPATDHA